MTVSVIDGKTIHDPLWGTVDARWDFAARLIAYEPDGDMLGVMPEPLDVRVNYPLSELPALQFDYRKDAPGADFLLRPDGLEVAVELYVPGMDKWVEPINSRFVVLDWEEDVVDPSNIIKVTAPGYGWLLSKVLVHKRKQDDGLRIKADASYEAESDAKRDYDSAWTSFNSVVTRARDAWKMRGQQLLLSHLPKTFAGKPIKHRSLLFHTTKRKFYWWSAVNKRWYLCVASSNLHGEASTAYSNVRGATNAYTAAQKKANAWRHTAREVSRNQKRPMVNVTAGAVMARLFTEARGRTRGRLLGMAPAFNGTYSSTYTGTTVPGSHNVRARRKWSNQFNIELTIGQSYLDVLNDLTEMGEIEWFFHKRQLRMYRPEDLGVKLTKHIALKPGTDMTEAPDRASRRDFANYLHIRGEEHTSFGMWNDAKIQATGWGVWEKAIAVSGVESVDGLKSAALKEARNALKRIKVESTRQIRLGSYNDYRPMYDYLPGQYIMAYASNGQFQQYRVMGISLHFSDTDAISGTITLGDKFMQNVLDFRKSMARTVGGYEKVIGGGTVPMLPARPAPEGEEDLRPIPLLAASVRAGVNKLSGQPSTVLTLAWQYSENPGEPDPVSPQEEAAAEQEAPPGVWNED